MAGEDWEDTGGYGVAGLRKRIRNVSEVTKKKTNAELVAENKFLRGHRTANVIGKTLHGLIKYGAFVLIAMFGEHAIRDLSGKQTQADINVEASAQVSTGQEEKRAPDLRNATACPDGNIRALPQITITASLLLGIAGWAYGRGQARLRRKVVERFYEYQRRWELSQDPKRTSSKLMPTGDTRPEDL